MKKNYRLILLLVVCVCFVLVLNAAASPAVYGVLDRFTENGAAVILLEDRGEEWIVEANEIPESSKEGVWFQMTKDVDGYSILSIDWKKTEDAKRETEKLLERLRTK